MLTKDMEIYFIRRELAFDQSSSLVSGLSDSVY